MGETPVPKARSSTRTFSRTSGDLTSSAASPPPALFTPAVLVSDKQGRRLGKSQLDFRFRLEVLSLAEHQKALKRHYWARLNNKFKKWGVSETALGVLVLQIGVGKGCPPPVYPACSSSPCIRWTHSYTFCKRLHSCHLLHITPSDPSTFAT